MKERILSAIVFIVLCMACTINHAFGQQLESILNETWVNNTWENASLQTRTYDGNAYLINTLTQTRDVSSGTWRNSSQIIYSNDPSGNITQELIQNWDSNTMLWADNFRNTYVYNLQAKVETQITEFWTNGSWSNISRQVHSYDTNNYLINLLIQTWDSGAGNWKNASQINHTNNLNGRVIETVLQTADTAGLWTNFFKTDYSYTIQDQPLNTTTHIWDGSGWVYFNMNSYAYDSNNYLINTLNQLWDSLNMAWINSSQSNYTNNLNGSISNIVIQLYDSTANTWNNSIRMTYSYMITTGFEIKEEVQNTVFPNPVTDILNLKNIRGEVVLMDILGNVIYRKEYTSALTDEELNLSFLSPGIYLLKTKSSRIKLIKH